MLWGAMNNASLGMMATSWDMNSISQNISNVNTTGYKRKETLFKTVMSESKAAPSTYSGKLNVFGVQTADRTHIAAQGVITASNHTTDLAINGSGFFAVGAPQATTSGTTYSTAPATSYDASDPGSVLYTRAGNFSTISGDNGEAYFMANGGNYLLGWMPDAEGVIDTSGDLVPVYSMPDTVMEGQETTTATLRGNINANATLSPSTFTTTQSVVDPNTSDSEELTLTWNRVSGTEWTVTPSVDSALGSVTSGAITVECDINGVIYSPAVGADAVDITWTSGATTSTQNLLGTANTHTSTASFGDPDGTSQTATLNWTRVTGNLWDVTVSVPAGVGTLEDDTVRVAFDGQGRMISPSTGALPFVIDWDASYDTATSTKMNSEISLYAGNDLPSNSLKRPDVEVEKLSTQVWDSNFESHDVTVAFERIGPNDWYMHTYSPSSSYPDSPAAAQRVAFTSSGLMTSATTTYDSSWTWTDSLVTGTGTQRTVSSADGSATVTFDYSALTQYDATQTLGSIDQNGYGEGSLISAYFNDTGEYIGQYTNGETNPLFKVAIAQFRAENSLENVSGTLFRRTAEAGDVTITGIEDAGGAVSFATSSLEGSNVDIGEEFTKMIVTQKAYSTNATVFKTADEMTTVARDLKA